MNQLQKVMSLIKNPKRIIVYIKKTQKFMGIIKQSDYRKFIILSRSRTGSNLLFSYLNGHPNIIANNEIFQWPNKKGYQKILKNQFRKYPKSIKAVGFKIFYDHPLGEENHELWSELMNMKNLFVIHLKRRNILRTLLSLKLALETDKWVKFSSEKFFSKKKIVSFITDELEQGFIQTRNWEKQGEAMFSDHPLITIWYQELDNEPVETLNKVTSFLGVEPCETRTYLQKQNPEKSSDLIMNFEELKNDFFGTPWESFFHD